MIDDTRSVTSRSHSDKPPFVDGDYFSSLFDAGCSFDPGGRLSDRLKGDDE